MTFEKKNAAVKMGWGHASTMCEREGVTYEFVGEPHLLV